jgi:hypothetical protein
MKHGLLITAMSFVLVAGAGSALAITPLPGGIPGHQQMAQAQPGGSGQQPGDEGTSAKKPAKRGAQAQPSGEQGAKKGEQGTKAGEKGAQAEPGQAPSGEKKAPSSESPGKKMGQGEKASPGTKTPGEKSAGKTGHGGSQGEKMGQQGAPAQPAGRQPGSQMGKSGSEQPGAQTGAAPARGESGKAAGAEGSSAKGSASLTTEERTKITTVIKEAKVRPLDNVTFAVSVGTRVPHDVHLNALPREVVAVHPAWRHYEYVLVRDDIIVIDPASFEIVAVLPLA